MQNNAKCQKKNPQNATNSFTVRNTSHFDVNELLCCDLVKDDDFKQSMIMIDHFSVRALKWNLFNWSSQIICHGKMANNLKFTSRIFVDLVMVSLFMLENYPKSWAIFSSSFYIGWALGNCKRLPTNVMLSMASLSELIDSGLVNWKRFLMRSALQY